MQPFYVAWSNAFETSEDRERGRKDRMMKGPASTQEMTLKDLRITRRMEDERKMNGTDISGFKSRIMPPSPALM